MNKDFAKSHFAAHKQGFIVMVFDVKCAFFRLCEDCFFPSYFLVEPPYKRGEETREWFNGRTSAFHAEHASSILVSRSTGLCPTLKACATCRNTHERGEMLSSLLSGASRNHPFLSVPGGTLVLPPGCVNNCNHQK